MHIGILNHDATFRLGQWGPASPDPTGMNQDSRVRFGFGRRFETICTRLHVPSWRRAVLTVLVMSFSFACRFFRSRRITLFDIGVNRSVYSYDPDRYAVDTRLRLLYGALGDGNAPIEEFPG
jgi:hypothetical protein